MQTTTLRRHRDGERHQEVINLVPHRDGPSPSE
jgi:hypothetical protein